MKIKHVFLTSGMIMAIATFPAISEDYYNSDIANSCQVDFLGGTGADNSTAPNSFQAQYDANEYTVSAGQYLAADAITGTQCPANSFCPGGTYTFNEDDDQGITACPSGFTLSAAGASAQTDCYRTCTTDDVAHSATVSGGFYYDNNNQCVPESCVTGYHVQAGAINPLLGKESIDGDDDGYQSDSRGSASAYSENTGKYNITEDQSWATEFSYGIVRGIASCNTTEGTADMKTGDVTTKPGDTFNQENTGEYCWCKITGYTPTSGTLQSLSSSWVFFDSGGDADGCAGYCAYFCGSYLGSESEYGGAVYREAMFGTVSDTLASCVANKINVTWNPANGNASTTNQCTYDGAITLPDAPEKTGYTFKGWKLVTGSSN